MNFLQGLTENATNFGAAAPFQVAGSLLNAGISAVSSKLAMKRQLRYQTELMQRQYDLQHKFWEEQNEYNSPASQMQRFKDAGLNTNLMYGDGSAGNASGVSVGSGGSISASDYGTPNVNHNPMMLAQLEIARSEANKNNAQANYYNTHSENETKQTNSNIEFNLSRMGLNSIYGRNILDRLGFFNDTKGIQKEILSTKNSLLGLSLQGNKYIFDHILPLQKEKLFFDIKRIKADIKLIAAKTGLSYTQAGLMLAQTAFVNVQKSLKQWDLDLRNLGDYKKIAYSSFYQDFLNKVQYGNNSILRNYSLYYGLPYMRNPVQAFTTLPSRLSLQGSFNNNHFDSDFRGFSPTLYPSNIDSYPMSPDEDWGDYVDRMNF